MFLFIITALTLVLDWSNSSFLPPIHTGRNCSHTFILEWSGSRNTREISVTITRGFEFLIGKLYLDSWTSNLWLAEEDMIEREDVNFFIGEKVLRCGKVCPILPYPTAVTPWSNWVPHSPVKTPLEYNWNSEPLASIATEIGWLATAFSKDFSLLAGTSSLREEIHSNSIALRDMSKLEELHLDDVNLSSTLPKSMQNLSSLISLSLSGCRLYEEFPQYIFHLPNIQAIDVSANENLSGFLPVNFCSGSKLKSLNLSLVSSLDLRFNNFNGQFPSALYNI
ncbi:hypothetical protein F8388_008155 [Cannabis sativa]|uniref:Uncharacterized protein n=1 Tax=Cannabis sativa TaxID=3483 RepID=A0A7J6EV28_CANSA|nr:hypothetical protein F8388_008155 [Cannabis sativa]